MLLALWCIYAGATGYSWRAPAVCGAVAAIVTSLMSLEHVSRMLGAYGIGRGMHINEMTTVIGEATVTGFGYCFLGWAVGVAFAVLRRNYIGRRRTA